MWLMWLTFAIVLFLNVPIAFVLIIASLVFLLKEGLSLTIIAQQLVGGMGGYTMIAVPLYILAGELMNTTGITKRLFNFCMAIIGHIRGGLAHVNVLGSMIFAGISGSSSADAAGLGRIEIQAMVEDGYDKEFASVITVISSMLGPIIPPSIHLVLFSAITEVSTGRLFAGGILPGVLLGILLMLFIHFQLVTGREKCPVPSKTSIKGIIKATKEAIFALFAPVLILSGILFGIVTATEAAALAVIYCLILGLGYRELKLENIPTILRNTINSTGVVMLVLAASQLLAWAITIGQMPQLFAEAVLRITDNKYLILLMFNLIFLISGCFLTATSGLLILTPILVGMASVLNLDMVHLGVWMVFALMIGIVTPPVGGSLYIVCDIAQIPFERLVKRTLPYYIPLVVALLLITYFPQIVTFLPNLLFK